MLGVLGAAGWDWPPLACGVFVFCVEDISSNNGGLVCPWVSKGLVTSSIYPNVVLPDVHPGPISSEIAVAVNVPGPEEEMRGRGTSTNTLWSHTH